MSDNGTWDLLTKVRSLRVSAREQDLDVLKKALVNLTTIVNEREQEAEAERAKVAEQESVLAALQQKIADSGVDIELLMAALEGKPAKSGKVSKPAKMKYEYIDLDGNVQQWSGRGLTPLKFKELMESNNTNKDDYLIK
jgi:DNA-binding protein H-NS